MNIFTICSALNISGHGKSIYSVEERFNQTLYTIKSIRDRDEKSYIIFCENSPISIEHRSKIELIVDKFISINDGDVFYKDFPKINYSSGKSKAEAYQMINAIEFAKNLEYEVFFKISARYYLLDTFDLNKFKNDKINFRELDHGYLCNSTVLYSFCKKHEVIMQKKMMDIIPYMDAYSKDIETAIHSIKYEYPNEVNNIEYLGVAGNIAPSGDPLEH